MLCRVRCAWSPLTGGQACRTAARMVIGVWPCYAGLVRRTKDVLLGEKRTDVGEWQRGESFFKCLKGCHVKDRSIP